MKTFRFVFAGLTVLAFAVSPTLALAQATTTGATAPGGKPGTASATEKAKPIAPGDKKFVKDAADSLYYELALAEKTKIKGTTLSVDPKDNIRRNKFLPVTTLSPINAKASLTLAYQLNRF